MIPLCTLVVDAREWGRFLLLFDAAVLEWDRGFGALISNGGCSGNRLSKISQDDKELLYGASWK